MSNISHEEKLIQYIGNNPNCTKFDLYKTFGQIIIDTFFDPYYGYITDEQNIDHDRNEESDHEYFYVHYFSSKNPNSTKNTYTLTKLGRQLFQKLSEF